MPLKYTTVVFDLDGTLLDSSPGISNAVHYALRKLGRSLPDNFDMRALIGPPLKFGFHKILGLDQAAADHAVTLYREYYGDKGLYEAALYPGVAALLRELRDHKAKVCLATSKYCLMAEKMLDHFELRRFLHYSVMSDGTELTSGKKAMLSRVLEYCGAKSENTVMVGDTVFDAEGARDNGMPFIGVLYGYGSRASMSAAGAEIFAEDAKALRGKLLNAAPN